MGGYALMTAKGGFKLTPVANEGNHGTSSKGGVTRQLTATQVDMGRVAAFLARETGRPVEDQTHILGVYTFTLEWAPEMENGGKKTLSVGISLSAAEASQQFQKRRNTHRLAQEA